VSDTVINEQQHLAPSYTNGRKRTARKPAPKIFIHRVTFCIDDSELTCLNEAKLAFRATEAFVVRMALDSFLKAQGLMTPTGFPANHGGSPNGR
jgi:hypothetical protein